MNELNKNVIPSAGSDFGKVAQRRIDEFYGVVPGKNKNGLAEQQALMLIGDEKTVNDTRKALNAKQPIHAAGVIVKMGLKQLKDRAAQLPRHMGKTRSAYAKALKAVRNAIKRDHGHVAAPTTPKTERPSYIG